MKKAILMCSMFFCVSLMGQGVPKGQTPPQEKTSRAEKTEKVKDIKGGEEKRRDEKEDKQRPLRMATREKDDREEEEHRKEKQDREERVERPSRPEADMPRMGRVESIYRNEYGYGRKSTPPAKARMVYHSGVGYRYYKGVYYKPYARGEWVVSRPPVGVVVAAVMLEGLAEVIIPEGVVTQHARYHYLDGVFYVKDPTNNYYVARAPVGVLVAMLPSGSERVIDGREVYFMVDGYRYTPISYNGRRMYRVDGRYVK
ncbi:MAG: hypothetical protein IIY15_00625 [Flavobacteriales bacterium]|nr:hypothetical protein [Flavobacteriales bacterium]